MNNYIYLITPFFAWLSAGSIKFIINSIRAKQFAFKLVGYGGMPSNHSAIVTSMASLIAFKEGINSPIFGIALTLAFIVMMDANGLRQTVGKHAKTLNKLISSQSNITPLKERVGHLKIEILGGIIVGVCVGYICSLF